MAKIWLRNKTWYIDYNIDGKRYRKRIGRSREIAEIALHDVEKRVALRNYYHFCHDLTRELGEDGGCAICGYTLILEKHHFIPKSQNGSNSPGNLIKLCPNHHRLLHLALGVLRNTKDQSHKEQMKKQLEYALEIDHEFAFFYRENAAQIEQIAKANSDPGP